MITDTVPFGENQKINKNKRKYDESDARFPLGLLPHPLQIPNRSKTKKLSNPKSFISKPLGERISRTPDKRAPDAQISLMDIPSNSSMFKGGANKVIYN
jgi:hypothetical protein